MSQYQEISVIDAVSKIEQGAYLLDIRDPQSFAAGHPKPAMHLSNDNFSDFIEDTASDTPLIVICYHGNSSRGVAQHLVGLGFQEVYSLTGGFADWSLSQAVESDV